MKISRTAREIFEFYCSTPLDMIGRRVGIGDATPKAGGMSALECFHVRESTGEGLPCCEPQLLQKALRGKQSWDLQINMWAESFANDCGPTLQQEELHDYCRELPACIFTAVLGQAAKILKAKIGFAPRFARLETVYGHWWPPRMDDFDWSI